MTECFPTVSCDVDGEWLVPFEQENETYFMHLLTTCTSYEEFMLKSDIDNVQYNAEYFGFSCIEKLHQFVEDYYTSKTRFLPNDTE